MNQKLIIRPLVGVGPIKFGMHRSSVLEAFPVAPKPFRKTQWSEHDTDAFDDEGLHVYYRGSKPVVGFIEMFHEDTMVFLLNGVDVFRTVSSDLIAHLCSESKVIEEEPGCCFIFPTFELSLWRSTLPESNQFDRFQAIGIGCEGYFSKENCEQGA